MLTPEAGDLVAVGRVQHQHASRCLEGVAPLLIFRRRAGQSPMVSPGPPPPSPGCCSPDYGPPPERRGACRVRLLGLSYLASAPWVSSRSAVPCCGLGNLCYARGA